MPRKALFSKEKIVEKAFELVRKKGADALTARDLGAALGSSSRPIFTVFENMEAVKTEVRNAAKAFYDNYMADVTDYVPAFKEYGKRLIAFAKNEKHLFRLLFLDKDGEKGHIDPAARICVDAMKADYGLDEDQALNLLNLCWTFTCGMAVLTMTEAVNYTDNQINEMLGYQFISTLYFIKTGQQYFENIAPKHRNDNDEGMTLKVNF